MLKNHLALPGADWAHSHVSSSFGLFFKVRLNFLQPLIRLVPIPWPFGLRGSYLISGLRKSYGSGFECQAHHLWTYKFYELIFELFDVKWMKKNKKTELAHIKKCWNRQKVPHRPLLYQQSLRHPSFVLLSFSEMPWGLKLHLQCTIVAVT